MGNGRKTRLGATVHLKDGDKALSIVDHRAGKANYEQIFKPAAKKAIDFLIPSKKSLQQRVDLVKGGAKAMKRALGFHGKGIEAIGKGVGNFLKDQQKLTKTGLLPSIQSPLDHENKDPHRHDKDGRVANRYSKRFPPRSPFNSHGGPHLGEGHDIKKRMQFDPANRKRVDEMPQSVKDSLQGAAWDYGAPYYSPKFQVNVDPEDGVLYNRPIYSDGTMLTYPSLDKPVKRETEINKPPTPLNHCESEMMHEGGWSKMRTINSPNTVSNKEGIKHNEMMRENIGGFKMPHSPLNQGHDIKKDSLGEKEAWAKWEKGYMDRTHKFKGTKFEKPITAEENKKEMESERHEFKYDKQTGQIRLRKTDDAENPIERKSRCWEGYEATPGVKAYEPGSCRKK